jgi:hypothetical protein
MATVAVDERCSMHVMMIVAVHVRVGVFVVVIMVVRVGMAVVVRVRVLMRVRVVVIVLVVMPVLRNAIPMQQGLHAPIQEERSDADYGKS